MSSTSTTTITRTPTHTRTMVEDAPIQPSPNYIYVDGVQAHWTRKKAIMQTHPKIKQLEERDIMSAVWCVIIVAGLLIVPYFIRDAPWWFVILLSYLGGATASHSLWVLIHEFTHDLAFKSKFWNNVFLLIANLPHVFASSITFADKHKQHHAYLNETYDDPDVPLPIEDTVFGHTAIGKAIWMLLFPISMVIRQVLHQFYSPPSEIPTSIRIKGYHFWVLANWICNLTVLAAVYYYSDIKGVSFLLISFFSSLGFHPLGARWIAEHYAIFPDQETYSYYGFLNKVSFNIGYHNEHHDFPRIPWSSLPKVKKEAPEFYDNLHTHGSYVRVLWDFVTNPNFTLRTRVVRQSHRLKKYQKGK